MAQGNDPIEIYQSAAQGIVSIAGSVNAGQLGSNTPCSEWTVKNLLNHNINVQKWLHATLTGVTPEGGEVDDDLPQEGAEAALKSITDQVIATANGMDLAANMATPFGEMPGGQFIMTPMMDMVIHRWDLASATGQNNAIDNSIAEICLGILVPQFLEGGRKNGAFGPEVVVPAAGTVQERLLGAVGRTP
jgi:uncharacterized protein (TIGR03086 family)